MIQFRNSKLGKHRIGPSRPSGLCRLTIGDMHSSILHFYKEQLKNTETTLAEQITNVSNKTFTPHPRPEAASEHGAQTVSIIIPAPQEFPLFRPAKARVFTGDIFEAIGEEMESIREADEKSLHGFDSSLVQSDSEDSSLFDGGAKKATMLDRSNILSSNERLFGNISLSFFPILW